MVGSDSEPGLLTFSFMGLTNVSKQVQKPSQKKDEGGEPDWFSELVERSTKGEAELAELVDEKIHEFQGLVTGRAPAAILVGPFVFS